MMGLGVTLALQVCQEKLELPDLQAAKELKAKPSMVHLESLD